MTGSQIGAEKGTLTLMCGGRTDAIEAARPVMEAYSSRIVHVGKAGAGQTAKMANQICIAGIVAALAEAVRFAQASHLDMGKVYDAISGGAAQSWQMDNRWQSMAEGPLRLRLCDRLDAQRPGPGDGRRARYRRVAARHRAGRPVLCRSPGHGRRPAGYQRADPPPAEARREVRAALVAALPLLFATSGPVLADTLIDNVNGITLDAAGQVERFNGVLIGDDGRIEMVLKRGDKRPGKVDFLYDGKGRVLLPGMIDAHGHVMELGFQQLTLDLSGTKTLAEAQDRLRAYAAAHPDRPWIVGFGWNERVWGMDKPPVAADLDVVVADRPVWLIRADGHAGWANSVALAAGKVTAATKDPAGGRIERVAGTARPSGILVDAARALVADRAPQPRPEDRDLALLEAQEVLLRSVALPPSPTWAPRSRTGRPTAAPGTSATCASASWPMPPGWRPWN
jgi:hypothetical protein